MAERWNTAMRRRGKISREREHGKEFRRLILSVKVEVLKAGIWHREFWQVRDLTMRRLSVRTRRLLERTVFSDICNSRDEEETHPPNASCSPTYSI